jgi:F0F1-type ATP synthase assembly protein I
VEGKTMVKFAIWGVATLALLITMVDKMANSQPPSWFTVFLAFAAGAGVLQIAHVLHEEAEERKAEEEQKLQGK